MALTAYGCDLTEAGYEVCWLMSSRPRRRVSKVSKGDSDQRAIFGQNLQAARLAQNRTQQELASAAGISRQAVSLAESAQANITLDHMEHLARALGIELSDLLRNPAIK